LRFLQVLAFSALRRFGIAGNVAHNTTGFSVLYYIWGIPFDLDLFSIDESYRILYDKNTRIFRMFPDPFL
jgi:hypothetical protein